MATTTTKTTGWVGWVAFGAAMMMLSGVYQLVVGFAAIFNSDWLVFANQGVYLLDLTSWGWVHALLGVLLIGSGISLFSGSALGRAVGTVVVSLAILANLLFLFALPVWSVMALIVDSLVLYAILAHGDEMKPLAETSDHNY
ncbi:hypothetical protein EPO04_03540 [Patescibacteria group bacterium]|nr:MAG: hypothetical protein EPO04_03540 [Patescibacteria group bacterium]